MLPPTVEACIKSTVGFFIFQCSWQYWTVLTQIRRRCPLSCIVKLVNDKRARETYHFIWVILVGLKHLLKAGFFVFWHCQFLWLHSVTTHVGGFTLPFPLCVCQHPPLELTVCCAEEASDVSDSSQVTAVYTQITTIRWLSVLAKGTKQWELTSWIFSEQEVIDVQLAYDSLIHFLREISNQKWINMESSCKITGH